MSEFLQSIIPSGNRVEKAFARGSALKANMLSDDYQNGFVGAFLTTRDNVEAQYESDGWITRAGNYLRDEYLASKEGPKFLSEIAGSLPGDHGGCHMSHQYSLDLWKQTGKGVMPYSTAQDYGSCVDASLSEVLSALLGARIMILKKREEWRTCAAWYAYALRGYCSDGWNAWGALTALSKLGVGFRQTYTIGGRDYDFVGDDSNEQLCARTWCRGGPPADMRKDSLQNFPINTSAVTEFDGGVTEIVKVFANHGMIHWSGSGSCMSGSTKPFVWGRVGPHQMLCYGADSSEEGRKWAKDVCGKTISDNDVILHMGNTWATRTDQWGGECSEQYWPGNWSGGSAAWRAKWGERTACSWICSAAEAVKRCSFDMVYLPEAIVGFPGDPLPPTPEEDVKYGGAIYAEQLPSGLIAIRGTTEITVPGGSSYKAIIVPDGAGRYKLSPKPVL